MPTGNDCPACGENIGLAAVFKAPVPNRIYCPHCGERLRYGETWGLIIAAVLGALVLGCAALEIACVMVLWHGGYRLEPVNRPKDDWEDF